MEYHDYALLGGVNRAKIGQYIARLSAGISALLVFVLLTVVDVAQRLRIPVNLPPTVLSLVGAGAVFSVLYWLFNNYIWRWSKVGMILRVPNLSGEWQCQGETLNPDGTMRFEWSGTVTIVQSWDKLRVRLKTTQSGSNSITAALLYDDAEGYRLLYNYRNDPKIDQVELSSHLGFADVLFSKDLRAARGSYFNGHGRFTFGNLQLSRR